MAVAPAAVGVEVELSLVGPPGVGGFDYPPESERQSARAARRRFGASLLDVEIGLAALGEFCSGLEVVVAAVEMQHGDAVV